MNNSELLAAVQMGIDYMNNGYIADKDSPLTLLELEALKAHLTQPLPEDALEPKFWVREWQGDDSDLGNFMIEIGPERPDEDALWFPVYDEETIRAALQSDNEVIRDLAEAFEKLFAVESRGTVAWSEARSTLTKHAQRIKDSRND